MPEGSNQEELIKIRLQAVADTKAAIKDLESLNSTLSQMSKMRGPSVGADRLSAELNSAAQSATRMSTQLNKSKDAKALVSDLKERVSGLRQELARAGKAEGQIGLALTGNKAQQSAQWKAYTDGLQKYQYAITATPEKVSMAIRNVSQFRKALNDSSIAGRATAESINAMNQGSAPAFMGALSRWEKMKMTQAAVAKQADALSYTLRNNAQQSMWAAKQLTTTITLPLVGLATVSVNSFAKVSAQMAQIKKITDFKEDYDAFTQSIRTLGKEFGTTRLETTTLYRNIAELGTSGLKNIEDYAKKVQNLSLVSGASLDDSLLFFRTVKAVFAEGMPGMDTTQKQFAKTEEIIAQFNTIADRTTIKLSELAEAFPEVAPVMEQMGFSAAGVGASIASIHKAGIPAVEAAHALKFGLQRIADPTKQAKQYIDAMNFSFFDAKGNITNADKQVMAFAQSLSQLNDEQKLVQIGEIFGKRQAARLSVFVDDVEMGRQELIRFNEAMKSGGDFTTEAQKMQSSYARALVFSGQATGETSRATDRYAKAIQEIKKDPSVGLKRMKAAFDDIKVQIGAVLAPAFISLGQKIADLGQKFLNMSPALQKFIIAILGFAASLGPIRYVTSSFGAMAGAVLHMVKAFIPVRYVSEAVAQAMIAQGMAVGQVGGAYVNLEGFTKRQMINFLGLQNSTEALTATTSSLTAANAELSAMQEALSATSMQLLIAEQNLVYSEMMLDQSGRKLSQSQINSNFIRGMSAQAADQYAIANAEATQSNLIYSASIKRWKVKNEEGIWVLANLETALSQVSKEQRVVIEGLLEEGFAAPVEKWIALNEAITGNSAAMLTNQGVMAGEIVDLKTLSAATEEATIAAKAQAKANMEASTAGAAKAGGGIFSSITGFLSSGPGIAVIIALLVTLGAVAYGVFLTIKDHMDKFRAAMQPGIDAIKDAWNGLKEAFKSIGQVFTTVFDQLGSFSGQSDEAAAGAETLGTSISTLASGFAKIIDGLAAVIRFLKPFFESIAYRFKDLIGVVESLLSGDWPKALSFLLAGLYETVRPALMILDVLVKAVAQAFSSILSIPAKLAGLAGNLPFIGGIYKGYASGIKAVAGAAESLSDKGIVGMLDDKLRNLGGVFDSVGSSQNKKAAEDAGKTLGKPLGDKLASSAGDAASKNAWIKDWVSKVVSALDEELKKVRDSAVDAMKKAHEEALKVYDERIKVIDDQEKAEEKLYRTEEYLSKKRELLDKRNIDLQNYKNNRAKAIYEGRYNDVRIMDMEEQKSKQDYSDQVSKIETDRQKDLLKDYRDNLKNQINAEKDAAKEKFDIQEKYFEAMLDGLMKQTPLTVAEFQGMMDKINSMLDGAGVSWPGYAVSAMERFSYVLNDANDKVINDFRRSGEDAVTAWMEAFARPEVAAILQKLSQTGSGGGAGGGGGDAVSNEPADTPAAAPGSNVVDLKTKALEIYQKVSGKKLSDEEQAIVDKLKEQIAEGKTINVNNKLYKDALEQRKIDMALLYNAEVDWNTVKAKGGELIGKETEATSVMYKTIIDSSGKATKEYTDSYKAKKNMIEDFANSSRVANQAELKDIKKTADSFKYFTDKSGDIWTEHNGKLVNQFGSTAEFIRDKNGNLTGTIIDQYGNMYDHIKENNVSTFTTAQRLLQDMKNNGIDPGSEAARIYIEKINQLGYEVRMLPDGKPIIIDADTSRAYEKVRRLGKFLQDNKMEVGFDIVGLMQNGGIDEAMSYFNVGPDLSWINRLSEAERNRLLSQAPGRASGGLVQAQKDGVLTKIAEGGYDEYVITTDPKYRSQNIGYLISAASQLGLKAASGAAVRAYNTSSSMPSAVNTISESYSNTGGDTYISVDTFIGQEEWFAEMAKKYDMKTVSKGRKIAGQQKRVISSYNNRWDIR